MALAADHVSVRNSCCNGSSQGQPDVATGEAYPVSGSNNARLKAQIFWPFKGDYRLLALDDNYLYAMVGHRLNSHNLRVQQRKTRI